MKNPLVDYDATNWRKLHDNASSMAKNLPNITWSDPLMRIAQAAMEMEANVRRATLGGKPDNENPSW